MELNNGIVVAVPFHNEENGFTVIKVRFNDLPTPVTCTGIMPLVSTGETVDIKGRWETHERYGKQFVVDHIAPKRPTTIEGIFSLLSSGILKNIGPVRARQIVERFGLETLNILDKNPERLAEIPGFGKKTVQKITEKWNKDDKFRNLIIFLKGYDVSLGTAIKIYNKYGEDAQFKIMQNPYALCEDIWGIGFLKADHIARKIGFSHDSYKRIQAGILYIMQNAADEGHSCFPLTEACQKAAELLEVDEPRIRFSLDYMISERILIHEGDWIFLPYLYYSEKTVALNIINRLTGWENSNRKGNDICRWLEAYERKKNWHADPVQRKAVIEAVNQPCILITGGPGTGKTTIIKVLATYFAERHKKILLAAPTGRAAQRLKELTEIKAQTVHRLLEYKLDKGENGFRFNRNESNPLDADAVIIDEMSMVDLYLMSKLCVAVKKETALIFVGDNNQLPSVGAGNVLSDMIDSKIIPHVHLTTIFRQALQSRIITAAHEINSGITPKFGNSKDENCFFLEESDPDVVLEKIIDLVSRRLPISYHLNPVHDIQVLSPMHKGLLGTEHLNQKLQEVLRSSSKCIKNGRNCFYLGDKVMQIKNNYEKNVFNGDIGIITDIISDTGASVDFQGNIVSYELSAMDELIPAYCISIHKSQGSEFNAVIIPVLTQHYIMLQRNLIYTALTRAKKVCIFIGTKKALHLAVQTNKTSKRYSCLVERLLNGKIQSIK